MRKTDNLLDINMNVRVSKKDYDKIKKSAEMVGASVTGFCRMAAIQYADMFETIIPKMKEMPLQELAELLDQARQKLG